MRDARNALTFLRAKSVNVNFVHPEYDVASFDLKRSDIDHFHDNVHCIDRSTIYSIPITSASAHSTILYDGPSS